MPSDVDKAYIKKYKINDMLNELFNQLTSEKPENPVEFAIKHLERKLPPKSADEGISARPTSSILVSRILPLGQQADMSQKQSAEATMPPVATALFSKLLNRAPNAQLDSGDGTAPAASGGQFALSTFIIAVNRQTVKYKFSLCLL